MESSVLIAIVTAVASIIIALIRATASLRVTRLKEPPVQSSAVSVQPDTTVKALSANRTWHWIGSLLLISNVNSGWAIKAGRVRKLRDGFLG